MCTTSVRPLLHSPLLTSRTISFRSYQSSHRLPPSLTSSDRLTPLISISRHLITFTPTGNGSDVFGSDICTCKPYLTFAIEECIRTAQRGGVGVVVYFRKEGRALGEVTKCVFFCFFFVLQCYFRIRVLFRSVLWYFAPRPRFSCMFFLKEFSIPPPHFQQTRNPLP